MRKSFRTRIFLFFFSLALASMTLQPVLWLFPHVAHASSSWSRPLIPPLPVVEPGVPQPAVSLDGTWYWTNQPPTNYWDNSVDPSSWKQVPVPGDLAYQGLMAYCDLPCLTDKDVEYPYKQSFAIPSSFAGHEILMRFNAVYTSARVWVNGQLVGTHRGAFSQWDVDITNAVTPGKKAWITVGVTAESKSPAFRHLRGITRDISLIALPKNYAMRLQATTDFDASYTNATLQVATGVVFNGGSNATVNLQLADPAGKNVTLSPGSITVNASNSEGTAAIPVSTPLKWDAEHPNLYLLTATYVVDGRMVEQVREQVGFRKIVVNGNQVLVNGHTVKLHGTDYAVGSADHGFMTTPAEDIHNLQALKAANINYIRTAHMAPDETVLAMADQLGIYVEYETSVFFVGQGQAQTQNDPSWAAEYVGQFAENIEADESHPSILYWSLGNENTVWGSNMDAMVQYVKQADTTRPTKFSYGWDAPSGAVSIYSVHYPGPHEGGLTNSSQPVINDEYAHGFAPASAGPTAPVAFDPGLRDWYGQYLKDYWNPVYTTSGQLGGATWAALDNAYQGPGYNGVNIWGTLLDAWGREKPEYYNVKKVYTPDYIVDRPLTNPGAGQPLFIPIENRHDATNLNALSITYQVGSASGRLHLDLPPHTSGYLTIPARNWHDGENVHLIFSNVQHIQEDEYNLTISQPVTAFSEPTGPAPTVASDNTSLTVSNNKTFSVAFSKSTGMITAGTYNGSTVLTGGPFLNLGNVNLPGNWSLSSITSSTTGAEAIVKISGSYGNTGTTFELHIDGTGLIRTVYTLTNPPGGYTEVGVAYDVTGSANTLDWKRQGLWSSYPSDNIGRNTGTASEHKVAGTDAYGVKPKWSWSQDETDYYDFGKNDSANRGTNDFRSSKTNFVYASLVARESRNRLRAEGDGSGSVRAQVDGSNIRLNINNLWSVTNMTPCCNGNVKTIAVGSTYSNTVQMRLTDSDATHLTTTYTTPYGSPPNLAPRATVSAPSLRGDFQTIQDNDDTTGTFSFDNPGLPQDITYSWPSGQTFDQIVLSTTYAQGQGITNVDVQVSADGSTNWTQVAASGTMTYTTNDATVEAKTITFPKQTNMKGLRIRINGANLQWGHYAIIEFKVFNT